MAVPQLYIPFFAVLSIRGDGSDHGRVDFTRTPDIDKCECVLVQVPVYSAQQYSSRNAQYP